MSSKEETEPQEPQAPREENTESIEETILSVQEPELEETKLEDSKLEDSKEDTAVIPRVDTQEPQEQRRENSLVDQVQDLSKDIVVNKQQDTKANEQQELKGILAESTDTSVAFLSFLLSLARWNTCFRPNHIGACGIKTLLIYLTRW